MIRERVFDIFESPYQVVLTFEDFNTEYLYSKLAYKIQRTIGPYVRRGEMIEGEITFGNMPYDAWSAKDHIHLQGSKDVSVKWRRVLPWWSADNPRWWETPYRDLFTPTKTGFSAQSHLAGKPGFIVDFTVLPSEIPDRHEVMEIDCSAFALKNLIKLVEEGMRIGSVPLVIEIMNCYGEAFHRVVNVDWAILPTAI